MSADRPDPEAFVDDRERARGIDPRTVTVNGERYELPHDLIPDDFVARSSASTLVGALREAERATVSDRDALPRCPECESIRIRRKAEHIEMAHKRDTAYKCTGCGEHFDDPAPSREAERDGEQVTLREGVRE